MKEVNDEEKKRADCLEVSGPWKLRHKSLFKSAMKSAVYFYMCIFSYLMCGYTTLQKVNAATLKMLNLVQPRLNSELKHFTFIHSACPREPYNKFLISNIILKDFGLFGYIIPMLCF